MNKMDSLGKMELPTRSIRKIKSIVENASRLFVQFGYHKVTMESVAQYANVSKVTLYKYFEDKQALYEYILKESFIREYDEVVEIIESGLPYEEKVNDVVKSRIMKYYDKNVPVFNGEITLSLSIQKFIKQYSKKMVKQRKKLYEQGKLEGFIAEEVPDETLEIYFRVIQNGLISVFKDVGEIESDEFSQLLKILHAGVLGCHN